MINTIYKEALSYLNESGEDFSNGPNNEEAIKFVKKLYKLGASNIDVALNEEGRNKFYFNSELFVFLPKFISIDMMLEITKSYPDEISKEENGSIRLWRD